MPVLPRAPVYFRFRTWSTSEDLAAAVDSLADEIDELREDINQANRDARLQGAIEGSDAGPTTDQLWQIDRAWEIIPSLIEKLNDIMTSRIPAINRRLDAAGIIDSPALFLTGDQTGGMGGGSTYFGTQKVGDDYDRDLIKRTFWYEEE